ncbi:hypothetical protein [Paraburkholderia sartisoli]|uniref:hypothetical protein n=1 Tax=Paraburkholderia sartisoli TaxID=83784 RepID=UPI000B847C5E|nr:hypothetical protein [Paraburkholderia sartisoli]
MSRYLRRARVPSDISFRYNAPVRAISIRYRANPKARPDEPRHHGGSWSEAAGTKAVMDGRGSALIDLAKVNLTR